MFLAISTALNTGALNASAVQRNECHWGARRYNKDAATSLSRLLSALGKETRVTYDGLSALAAAESSGPTWPFWIWACREWTASKRPGGCEQPEGKDCILIALTGWGDKEDRCGR